MTRIGVIAGLCVTGLFVGSESAKGAEVLSRVAVGSVFDVERLERPAALVGVDLRCENQTVAIMGPSGAGKSTLLHCIGGLERPSAANEVFDLSVSVEEIPEDWDRMVTVIATLSRNYRDAARNAMIEEIQGQRQTTGTWGTFARLNSTNRVVESEWNLGVRPSRVRFRIRYNREGVGRWSDWSDPVTVLVEEPDEES